MNVFDKADARVVVSPLVQLAGRGLHVPVLSIGISRKGTGGPAPRTPRLSRKDASKPSGAARWTLPSAVSSRLDA
jgi:hypothetical protein